MSADRNNHSHDHDHIGIDRTSRAFVVGITLNMAFVALLRIAEILNKSVARVKRGGIRESR